MLRNITLKKSLKKRFIGRLIPPSGIDRSDRVGGSLDEANCAIERLFTLGISQTTHPELRTILNFPFSYTVQILAMLNLRL